MPDSFDDFSSRHTETAYQLQNPQRNPSTWSATQQYTDMAATYGTQRPYQSHNMAGYRPNEGLPPIRDLGQLSKYGSYEPSYISSNGQTPHMYSQSNNVQHESGRYGVRPDTYPDGTARGYSHTYPSNAQSYGLSSLARPIYGEYGSPTYPRGEFYPPYGLTSMNGASSPLTPASVGESTDGRNRRRRGNLPKSITDRLRGWFQDHLDHPYPSEEEKQMFMMQTGLTINQV